MSRFAHSGRRRAWWTIGASVVILALAVVIGGPLTGNLTAGGFEDPNAEYVRAAERIEQASGVSPSPDLIAVVRPAEAVTSPAGRAAVEDVAGRIAADPDVAQVVTAFSGGGPALISTDGSASYIVASFAPLSDDAAEDTASRLQDELAGDPTVTLGGGRVAGEQIGSIIGEDLAKAEAIAFPIIFLLSLWIFRGLVAALIPPLVGGAVILASFAALGFINEATSVSVYALNLVIGLSLGLAIDYSLLMVSRYREEIAARGPGREALERTLRTAGRSVLFSTVTVAAALAGLMLFPQGFLFSMGMGGVVSAALAAIVALVVLPAALALLGHRVNSLAPRAWRRRSEAADQETSAGFWFRLSHAVMRRPAIVAVATAMVLVVVALPALGIRFITADAGVAPTSASARQVHDALQSEFPEDRSSPVIVALRAPEAAGDAVADYAQTLGALPGAAAVLPPAYLGDDTWRVDLIPSTPGLSDEAQDLVAAVRDTPAPAPTLVGGLTASFVDEQSSIASTLPWAMLVIAAATIVALFLMTGSLLIPVKAVIMNLLTLGATLGIMVWAFQDEHLAGLLDYDGRGALDLTQPILLGAIAFGLSTDYAVFLLSRIKEAHDAGRDTREAVAIGLQRTGRIVTAAALLFAVAIGAFATSDIGLIKELGVGTAVAVLIDATVVRALLVPSLMALLGRWNWWAPRPLRRLHQRIGLSEGEQEGDPRAARA